MNPLSGIAYLGLILLIGVFLLRALLRSKKRLPAPIETRLGFPEKEFIWAKALLAQVVELLECQFLWIDFQTPDTLKAFLSNLQNHLQRDEQQSISHLLANKNQHHHPMLLWAFYSGYFGLSHRSQADANYWLEQACQAELPEALLQRAINSIKQGLSSQNWEQALQIENDLDRAQKLDLAAAAYLSVFFQLCQRNKNQVTERLLSKMSQPFSKAFLPTQYFLHCYQLAQAKNGGNDTTALQQLHRLARKGVIDAQVQLVLRDINGIPDENRQETARWRDRLLGLGFTVITENWIENNRHPLEILVKNTQQFDFMIAALRQGSIRILLPLLDLTLTDLEKKQIFNALFAMARVKNPTLECNRICAMLAILARDQLNDTAWVQWQSALRATIESNHFEPNVVDTMSELPHELLTIVTACYAYVCHGVLKQDVRQRLLQLGDQYEGLSILLLHCINPEDTTLITQQNAAACGMFAYDYAMHGGCDAKDAWQWINTAAELGNRTAQTHCGYLMLGEYQFDFNDAQFKPLVPVDTIAGLQRLWLSARTGDLRAIACLQRINLESYQDANRAAIDELIQLKTYWQCHQQAIVDEAVRLLKDA